MSGQCVARSPIGLTIGVDVGDRFSQICVREVREFRDSIGAAATRPLCLTVPTLATYRPIGRSSRMPNLRKQTETAKNLPSSTG